MISHHTDPPWKAPRPYSPFSSLTRSLTGDNSRVDTQQLGVRQGKPGEDGRRPEGGGRLPSALGAVADVQRQRLLEGRLEGDGPALAGCVHGDGVVWLGQMRP